MLKNRLNILFCLLFVSAVGQAVERTNGLLFSSGEEKVDNRTSLLFFDDKPLKIQDSLRLSFDISIWDFQRFGHIFRMIDERKKEVEFVFVNFYGDNQMYLDFHSPITHKAVQIPISKESIENKKLLHIDFLFNLEQDKTTITIDDETYVCTPIGLENPSAVKLAFGLYGLNLDVPQMLLKNICFDTFKNKILEFPLAESSGNRAYATKSREKATVKNPNWMINKHFYWQAKTSFTVDKQAFVTYDRSLNQLLITNGDSLLLYNLRNDVFSQRYPLHSPRNFRINDVLFNAQTNDLLLLGSEPLPLFERELMPNNCSVSYINTDDATVALHHNSFLSPTNDLFMFGGYSNYTYSNSLSKINLESLTREELNYSGDVILPRLYSGCAVTGDDVYIFGNFTAFDKDGNDISYRFSSKLRSLFTLILLNSGYKTGITTEKLTSGLWPDKELSEAKNIRGVTINRFRGVLADMEGITLQHQNSQWFFEFEKNFYLDYFEYRLLINELANTDIPVAEERLDKLYGILSKGTFLQSLQEQVFDTFKSTIEAELIDLLKTQIDALFKMKSYHKVVQFAGIYNMIDPTDKSVFDLCVKAYNKLDKKQESAVFINQYKKIYKNITGTDLLI